MKSLPRRRWHADRQGLDRPRGRRRRSGRAAAARGIHVRRRGRPALRRGRRRADREGPADRRGLVRRSLDRRPLEPRGQGGAPGGVPAIDLARRRDQRLQPEPRTRSTSASRSSSARRPASKRSQVQAILFDGVRREIERKLAGGREPLRARGRDRRARQGPRRSVRRVGPVPRRRSRTSTRLHAGRGGAAPRGDRPQARRRRACSSATRRFPSPTCRCASALITSLGSDAYHDVLRTLGESGFAFKVTVARRARAGARDGKLGVERARLVPRAAGALRRDPDLPRRRLADRPRVVRHGGARARRRDCSRSRSSSASATSRTCRCSTTWRGARRRRRRPRRFSSTRSRASWNRVEGVAASIFDEARAPDRGGATPPARRAPGASGAPCARSSTSSACSCAGGGRGSCAPRRGASEGSRAALLAAARQLGQGARRDLETENAPRAYGRGRAGAARAARDRAVQPRAIDGRERGASTCSTRGASSSAGMRSCARPTAASSSTRRRPPRGARVTAELKAGSAGARRRKGHNDEQGERREGALLRRGGGAPRGDPPQDRGRPGGHRRAVRARRRGGGARRALPREDPRRGGAGEDDHRAARARRRGRGRASEDDERRTTKTSATEHDRRRALPRAPDHGADDARHRPPVPAVGERVGGDACAWARWRTRTGPAAATGAISRCCGGIPTEAIFGVQLAGQDPRGHGRGREGRRRGGAPISSTSTWAARSTR